VSGELAAQKAGGNVWAGAFVGAILGGVTSLAGGVLGAALSEGVTGRLPLAQYVTTGALQGAIAGAGTGLALGYAGGKGSAEQMLQAAVSGLAWGASLGFLLSLGTGLMLGATVPKGQTPYLQIGNLANKYAADPVLQGGPVGAASAFRQRPGAERRHFPGGAPPEPHERGRPGARLRRRREHT